MLNFIKASVELNDATAALNAYAKGAKENDVNMQTALEGAISLATQEERPSIRMLNECVKKARKVSFSDEKWVRAYITKHVNVRWNTKGRKFEKPKKKALVLKARMTTKWYPEKRKESDKRAKASANKRCDVVKEMGTRGKYWHKMLEEGRATDPEKAKLALELYDKFTADLTKLMES